MQIARGLIDQFGGEDALAQRVTAFRAALDAHRFTVDIPAPVEHELVERLARSGEAIEPVEPGDEPGEQGPSKLAELQERLDRLEAALVAKGAISRSDVEKR